MLKATSLFFKEIFKIFTLSEKFSTPISFNSSSENSLTGDQTMEIVIAAFKNSNLGDLDLLQEATLEGHVEDGVESGLHHLLVLFLFLLLDGGAPGERKVKQRVLANS
jgi:hypothetical protein